MKKSKKNHIRQIATEILVKDWVKKIKFLLFIDDLVDTSSFSRIVWIAANNTDPMRDCFYIEREPGVKFQVLCIDGTRKTREFDDFQRDWPNVIVMDDLTIKSIDTKWENLGLGPLISSPSLIYKSLVINSGAISKEDK